MLIAGGHVDGIIADAVPGDQPRAAGAFGKAGARDARRVDVDRVVAGEIRRRDLAGRFGEELPADGWIIVQHAERFASEGRRPGGVQQVAGQSDQELCHGTALLYAREPAGGRAALASRSTARPRDSDCCSSNESIP